MKAIQITAFGGPEVLNLADRPTPQVTANTVLIKIEAAGVGYVDVMFRTGQYPGLREPAFTPGVEIAGTIIDVGADVSQALSGKKAFVVTQLGGYAEYIEVPAENLIILPAAVTAHQAVSLGVNALVAWFSLERARLNNNNALLVRGGGGGIGSATVQLAVHQGLKVTAETSSTVKAAALSDLGASIFDKSEADNIAGLFDAVIDPVAGAMTDFYVNLLKPNGTYVFNGAAGGYPSPDFGTSWLTRFQLSLSMHCVSLNAFHQEQIRHTISTIFQLMQRGAIIPLIADVFPLKDAGAAHTQLESGKTFGKIILDPTL